MFTKFFLYVYYHKLKKKHLLHVRMVIFRGLRPLDPHQGFALDPLGASRQPPNLAPAY
jgi:hypothetical protein